MSEVLKRSTATGVQLLKDDDGVYRVLDGDQELVRTKVKSLAQIEYDEAVDRLDDKKAVRAAERNHYTMQAVRSDSFARRAASARKTGGKGGRGGV